MSQFMFCYIHRSYITTEYQPAETFCNFCLTYNYFTHKHTLCTIQVHMPRYKQLNMAQQLFLVIITQHANRRFCVILLYGLPGSVTLLVITSYSAKFSEKCIWYEPNVLVVSTAFLIRFSHFRTNPAILLQAYLSNNLKCMIFLATLTNHSFSSQI